MKLYSSYTISGIDFEKCKNVELYPLEPYKLGVIDCFKTDINIYINSYIINNCDDKIKINLSHRNSNIKFCLISF